MRVGLHASQLQAAAQVPNGELSSTQLRELAKCIEPYGEDGCADITTRANIQLRGIPLDDASDVIKRVEAMGLTSFMTGMDNVRNLTGSPIAGLDPHELVDVRKMLVDMQVWAWRALVCTLVSVVTDLSVRCMLIAWPGCASM